MALTSLIIGCAELGSGANALRAAMPFLGQSLIEYQVRQAAAAGAGHVVVLVERVPAALVGAVDRLRSDGIAVELARSVADAADRIHPDEQLLLIGDGIVARQDVINHAARAVAPSLYTIPDSSETVNFERIDGAMRWAGLALIKGDMLRQTVAMLGDWDLQSTLLRRIVQAQAVRVETAPGALWLVESSEIGRAAETALLGTTSRSQTMPEPVARVMSTLLLGHKVRPFWLRMGAIAVTTLSIPAFVFGWPIIGLLAVLLSWPLLGISRQMDVTALRKGKRIALWTIARDVLFAGAIGALSWKLYSDGAGWGVWSVASALFGTMILLHGQKRLIGRNYAPPPAMVAVLFPFAVFHNLTAGLCATAVLGFGALLYGQHILVKQWRDKGANADMS